MTPPRARHLRPAAGRARRCGRGREPRRWPVIVRMGEITAAGGRLEVTPQAKCRRRQGDLPRSSSPRGPRGPAACGERGRRPRVAGLVRRETGGRLFVPASRATTWPAVGSWPRCRAKPGGLALYSETQHGRGPADLCAAGAAAAPAERVPRGSVGTSQVTLLSPDEGAVAYVADDEPAGAVTRQAPSPCRARRTTLEVELRKTGLPRRTHHRGRAGGAGGPALLPETGWERRDPADRRPACWEAESRPAAT